MTQATRSRKATQVYNIGPAENTKCLMVRIDWTTAAVAHIRANVDTIIEAEQVSYIKGVYTFIKMVQVKIYKGQHVYFSRSGRDGYYYINTGKGCTCVGNIHFHQTCKHLESVQAFQVTQCKLEAVRKQEDSDEVEVPDFSALPTNEIIVRINDIVAERLKLINSSTFSSIELERIDVIGAALVAERNRRMPDTYTSDPMYPRIEQVAA